MKREHLLFVAVSFILLMGASTAQAQFYYVVNIINNGDLEQGSNSTWQEHSHNGFDVICQTSQAGCRGNGNYSAWLGGAPQEWTHLTQNIFVPLFNPVTPELTYDYAIFTSPDGSCFDGDENWVYVSVYEVDDNGNPIGAPTTLASHRLCESDVTNGSFATSTPINMSAYAGRWVMLAISYIPTGDSYSNFYIDDIEIWQSPWP